MRLSVEGAELAALARRVEERRRGDRFLLGVAGPPGAGKSTFAVALVERLRCRGAVVPLDGFHLADAELDRQGLLGRKGAPETFDAWGYAALLGRLAARPHHAVYAPGFERELEQPLAGALAIPPEVDVVVTEGNYLLLDRPEWRAARDRLDEVWYVETDQTLRVERLVARHVTFGKAEAAARSWTAEVDGLNAALVAASQQRADLVVDLTGWSGS
jgi:pantothenate kinase